jgi:hypothetical protein
LHLDATQPDITNMTMIERVRGVSSFVRNCAGDCERRSNICPEEERTHSATQGA